MHERPLCGHAAAPLAGQRRRQYRLWWEASRMTESRNMDCSRRCAGGFALPERRHRVPGEVPLVVAVHNQLLGHPCAN